MSSLLSVEFCLKNCLNMGFVGVDRMETGGLGHVVGAVAAGPVAAGPAVELGVGLIILGCNLEFDLLSFFQPMNH